MLKTLRASPLHQYYCFVPASYAPGRAIVVLVHGISRNAREHAVAFAARAAETGVAVIAPLFTREFCRDYQRLGWTGEGQRADLLLQDMVAEVSAAIGARSDSFSMFGHSGGAQFAHRYALAWPRHVSRLALCAAGYYTLPDPAAPFPYGLDVSGLAAGRPLDLPAFLGIPTLVTVGARDTQRDPYLRRDHGLDSQQGAHRLERARSWAGRLRIAAEELRMNARVEMVVIPRAGHRFMDTVRKGMCDIVWPWLTAELPPQEPGRARSRPSQEAN